MAALLLPLSNTAVCEALMADASTPGEVNQDTLEAKIQGVESNTGMDEQAKDRLVALYREALSNLKTASSNAEAAEAFRLAAQTAPAQVQAIREELETSNPAAPEDSLRSDLSTPMTEITQRLQKEKADLAAVDAKREDLERRLEELAARPDRLRQRLTEAQERQQELAAEIALPPPAGEASALSEAKRWLRVTRYQALSAEIEMLDQDLLSQPALLDLLKIKRDREAASLEWVGARVKALEDLLNRKRTAEAERTKVRAEASRREAVGRHPLVTDLAEHNEKLSVELTATTSQLAGLTADQERTDRLARAIDYDFQGAREIIAIGSLSPEAGHILQQQRQTFPDLRSLRQQAKQREAEKKTIGLQRLRHRAEAKRIQDLDDYVSSLVAAEPTPPDSEALRQLRNLAKERQALLDKAIETDELLLSKLSELEAAELQSLATIEDYDAFLNEHLLWVKSASGAGIERLGALPEQVRRILSAPGWLGVARALADRATHSPVLVLVAPLLGILLWGHQRMLAAIRQIAERLGRPTTDRFGYTLQALFLTLLAASAWPLVLAVTGWELKLSRVGTDFSNAVAWALIFVGMHLFGLRAFVLICVPDGLAAAHFRWPEASLRLLRRELNWLTWVFVPAALIGSIATGFDPLYGGWEIGRIVGVIFLGSLAFVFFRLMHPKRGVITQFLRHREGKLLGRLYPLWFALLVAAPLVLATLSLLGFRYTAATLLKLLMETTWMALGLVLLNALAVRWLLVTRRHLAYQAAIERRHALSEGRKDEGVPVDVEEPDVDLVALSDASRKLLNTAIVFAGLIGLVMIWSEIFPAFRILDDVALWHHSVTVDGEQRVLPVTLANLGFALIFAVVTVLLAKQLPAVLEIILLKQSGMSSGSRYTVTTLTNYAIITIGVVLVFHNIGVDWSKLQWLVAALGVGIGFGLQEIVANFICGIIILFERPVRVGDVVTVGDTDGTVTRIRIRATTIRNWDGKELLVPNKEFITGRLLNWSLSDQTTRVLISVGIAYGSNVRAAMGLLEQAAREHEDVLRDPAPSVIFESFGDNALTMVLRCFVESVDLRLQTISSLNQIINDKFNAAGIVIAFPQRDLHLDTAQPLQVELRRSEKAPPASADPRTDP